MHARLDKGAGQPINKAMETSSPSPVIAKAATRGRPPKLTAAMIVQATRSLLEISPSADVSFARVARHLSVPASSVYNYFANRDVLFAAVAADVFASFAFTDPGDAAPWQQRLSAWLQELDRFIEKNPVAFRVMATSNQASPAWVHVRAPLLRVLRSLGFVDRELVLVHSWCEAQVVGLLLVETHAGRNRASAAAAPLVLREDVDGPDARVELARRAHLPSIRREDIVKLGFDAVIATLERLSGELNSNADGHELGKVHHA